MQLVDPLYFAEKIPSTLFCFLKYFTQGTVEVLFSRVDNAEEFERFQRTPPGRVLCERWGS